MTGTKWAERLTPFTAGMAISLLLVALVVQPAWAENNACSDCMGYWQSTCMDGNVAECAGLPKQQRWGCCSNYVLLC
jgi:hypothetical protein